MSLPLVGAALLPLLILLPFLVASGMAFTSLVKLEYANHRPAWEADGRPSGFYWWPPFSGVWASARSGHAANVLLAKWLFGTPSWVRADERAQRLLRRLRICVAVWNCGVVVMVVAAVVAVRLLP